MLFFACIAVMAILTSFVVGAVVAKSCSHNLIDSIMQRNNALDALEEIMPPKDYEHFILNGLNKDRHGQRKESTETNG